MSASGDDTAQGAQPRERGSNRIQVSSSKKPLFFYVNLAKRLLGEHDEVQLSALGLAVSTMVSIVEILKKDGLAVETKLSTMMEVLGEDKHRPVQKAKMEIVLKKTADFHDIIAAEASQERDNHTDKDNGDADADGDGSS